MHHSTHPTHTLDLRVHELQQLFNSLDPTPFLNKDLDRACELFIESWALALAHDSHLHLRIHVGQLAASADADAGEVVAGAVHNHYAYKADLVRGELRQLLHLGRMSLGVGLVFVVACLLLAETLTSLVPGRSARIAHESLTIIGWVAMWRPVQIFLYDWWPLSGRIKVFENLRRARVSVLPA